MCSPRSPRGSFPLSLSLTHAPVFGRILPLGGPHVCVSLWEKCPCAVGESPSRSNVTIFPEVCRPREEETSHYLPDALSVALHLRPESGPGLTTHRLERGQTRATRDTDLSQESRGHREKREGNAPPGEEDKRRDTGLLTREETGTEGWSRVG